MAQNTEDGYYGLSYGLYYGIGQPYPHQWYATVIPDINRPDKPPRRHFGDEILSVNIEPEHSAIWDAKIELPPVLDPTRYKDGLVRLQYRADRFITFRIESTSVSDSGVVALTGRAAAGLRLVGDETEVEYKGMRTVAALRDFWTRTPYTANVHPPSAEYVDDLKVTDIETPSGFDKVLKARARDEQGRFIETEDGSAPNFLPTDPLKVSDTGIELRQSNFLQRAWDNTGQEKGVERGIDFSAVDNQMVRLSGDGAMVEYTFKPGYDIPKMAIAPRWKTGGGAEGLVSIDIGGSTLRTMDIDNAVGGNSYSWNSEPFEFVRDETVSKGEHSITITKHGSAGYLYIDLIAICDARFSYNWDNSLDSNGQLFGPQLYPEHFAMEMEPVEPGIDVGGIQITTTFDEQQPNTNIGCFITGRGIVKSEQAFQTETHSFDVPDGVEVPRIVPRPEVSRTGIRENETPKSGFKSQTLKELSSAVDGIAVSVIHDSGQSFSGTDLDILQSIHEHAGYVFTLRGEQRQPAEFRAESFERGDASLTRRLPEEAIVTSLSEQSDTKGYANRVTVTGAEYPDALRREGDPQNFTATADDEDEIRRVGLEAITIEDPSLESKGACISRARTELRKRLSADSKGGSIDTTPAIINPGYPFVIPEITRSAELQRADSVTWKPDNPTRVIDSVTTIGDGESLTVANGELIWIDNTKLRATGSGTITVESGGEIIATTPGDIPPGETVTVTKAESPLVIREDSTIEGTLIIEDGARVVVFGGVTVTVKPGGKIVVHGTGEMETRSVTDKTITCESWSFSESPGEASASGSFKRLSGALGADDRADVLTLLNSVTSN